MHKALERRQERTQHFKRAYLPELPTVVADERDNRAVVEPERFELRENLADIAVSEAYTRVVGTAVDGLLFVGAGLLPFILKVTFMPCNERHSVRRVNVLRRCDLQQ